LVVNSGNISQNIQAVVLGHNYLCGEIYMLLLLIIIQL